MVHLNFDTVTALEDFQLDIVGFLAILGEASVLANAQVMFLSKWSYLPRLLPAPQALIRTERPGRLAPSPGLVVGTHSGNTKPELNHVAHVLHSDGDKLKPYHVAIISLDEDPTQDPAKAAWFSPVIFLSVLGCVFAAGLLAVSIAREDAFSLISTLLLSLLSTTIGIGQKWKLNLPQRKEAVKNRVIPKSDVVIAYPNGSFLIVKCSEDVARQLYWAPERCNYLIPTNWYRAISLVGTAMLMGGVISLANAQTQSQIAWAAAYVVLNAAYWVVAALPARWNWMLKSFILKDVKLRKLSTATFPKDDLDPMKEPLKRRDTSMRKPGTKRPEDLHDIGRSSDSFTQALWLCIAATKTSQWIKIAQIAPQTEGWDRWLKEAENAALQTRITEKEEGGLMVEIPNWDAQKNLTLALTTEPEKPDQDPKKVLGPQQV